MKAGSVGAIIVVAGGVVLAGLLFAKDGATLNRAQTSFDEGKRLLGSGDAKKARDAFEKSLEAALLVNGGLTGKRTRALELASESRAALDACDAIESLRDGDPRAVGAVDGVLAGKGARALGSRDAVDETLKKRLAQAQLEAAQALEKAALDADKRPGPAGEAKAEQHALAARAFELAEKTATAGSFDWAAGAAKSAKRCQARALVAGAIAANATNEGAKAKDLAQKALSALEQDVFEDEKERAALKAATTAIFAEGEDRGRVNELEEAVSKLEARVPTKELGTLLPDVERVSVPKLAGGHRSADELAKMLEALVERLERVREAARGFAGMVLVLEKGDVKVYVDRTEVTNEDYKAFVDEKKPYSPEGRTVAIWGSPEAARADLPCDNPPEQGPATWKSGTSFPAGQGKHPVAGVSALEARAFAKARGKRLPTLEEWLAAAGFPNGSPKKYPWGDEWKDSGGNVKGTTNATTTPVGSFPEGASSTGALDLIGNVREIVTVGEDSFRLVGGSAESKPDSARLDGAIPVGPEKRKQDYGFRCARELEWKR